MTTTSARPHPDLSSVELDALLKRLHLANMRHVHAEAIARAETEQWSYRDFLALLVAEEVAHRTQTRLQRLTRRAHFPYLKTIDDFDFTLQSQLRLSLLGSYLAPDFVTDGRSLILHGKTGRGKTHLSVAIAYRAIQHGFDALFTTAAQLIEDLSNAGRKGRLHEALDRYTHPHVLVIDEVGYLTYGPEAANVLYHVVNDRHLRKRPMVFTTNKPMHDWGRVLHDPDLASAILDRVLERGRWITLDGPSGRTKHLKLDPAIPQDGPGAIVSGKLVPEFPEPTSSAIASSISAAMTWASAVGIAARSLLSLACQRAGNCMAGAAASASVITSRFLVLMASRIGCPIASPYPVDLMWL
jgi:DNA replication protein DnaC